MASSWVSLANILSALEAKFCAMCSAVNGMSLCSASASSDIQDFVQVFEFLLFSPTLKFWRVTATITAAVSALSVD